MWFILVASRCGLHHAVKKAELLDLCQHEAKHMSRCYRVNVRFGFADYSLMYGQMKSSEGKLFEQPHDTASDSPQGTTVCPLSVYSRDAIAGTYMFRSV